MSIFKGAMDACYVTLAKEKTISEEIEISKIVHSIEEVYKIVDAVKKLVDTLNQPV